MRNCLMCVLALLAATLCTLPRASAQTDAETARVEGLLADKATAAQKVRAYDRLHQKVADIHAARAQALEKEGDREGAKGEVQRANTELTLARAAYELALERYPEHAEIRNYYGELLFDRFDEQEKGVAEWKKAVEQDESCGRAHNNLGIYLAHAGQYAAGLDHLDKAVQLEPENPDYQYNLAQIYLTNWPQVMQIRKWTVQELYAAAMKASETAARFAPGDFDLVADYARNFFMASQMDLAPDWEGAAAAWQRARPLARNEEEEFNTWLNEARVWYKAGKGQKTAKCCDQALRIRPQSLVAKELKTMALEIKVPGFNK